MKLFLTVTALLFAAVSAKNVKIAAIRDCGAPGSVFSFYGTIFTDPIPVPGNASEDLTVIIGVDTPDDLRVRKVTTRLNDNYTLPCINGFTGTCNFPLCFMIQTLPNVVCPFFPPGVTCECPIKANTYKSYNIPFGDEWLDVEGGVEGDYNSRSEYVSRAGTADEYTLGCVEVDFTLVAA